MERPSIPPHIGRGFFRLWIFLSAIWAFCVFSYWFNGNLALEFLVMVALIGLPASALLLLLMGLAWVVAGFLTDRADSG
jgi:hypothetical protein